MQSVDDLIQFILKVNHTYAIHTLLVLISEAAENVILFSFVQYKSSQLDKYKTDLESLNNQYRSLDETKGWLQRTLQETEVLYYMQTANRAC